MDRAYTVRAFLRPRPGDRLRDGLDCAGTFCTPPLLKPLPGDRLADWIARASFMPPPLDWPPQGDWATGRLGNWGTARADGLDCARMFLTPSPHR